MGHSEGAAAAAGKGKVHTHTHRRAGRRRRAPPPPPPPPHLPLPCGQPGCGRRPSKSWQGSLGHPQPPHIRWRPGRQRCPGEAGGWCVGLAGPGDGKAPRQGAPPPWAWSSSRCGLAARAPCCVRLSFSHLCRLLDVASMDRFIKRRLQPRGVVQPSAGGVHLRLEKGAPGGRARQLRLGWPLPGGSSWGRVAQQGSQGGGSQEAQRPCGVAAPHGWQGLGCDFFRPGQEWAPWNTRSAVSAHARSLKMRANMRAAGEAAFTATAASPRSAARPPPHVAASVRDAPPRPVDPVQPLVLHAWPPQTADGGRLAATGCWSVAVQTRAAGSGIRL